MRNTKQTEEPNSELFNNTNTVYKRVTQKKANKPQKFGKVPFELLFFLCLKKTPKQHTN